MSLGLSELIDILLKVKDARGFIRNEMSEVIEKIGDAQFKAATGALKRSRTSSDPNGEVRSAITHLQSAYEIFHQELVPTTAFKKFFRGPMPEVGEKCTQTATMLAMIYHSRRDSSSTREFISKAKECFQLYYQDTWDREIIHTPKVLKLMYLVTTPACKEPLDKERAKLNKYLDTLK